MNERKCYGKTLQGVWVYGWYMYSEKQDKHYIVGESADYGFRRIEVDPSTVGDMFTMARAAMREGAQNAE